MAEVECLSCKEKYKTSDAGTCKCCYKNTSDTTHELQQQIEYLNSKVSFLRFYSPHHNPDSTRSSFSDVVLVAAHDLGTNPVPISAHKAVLASRSPVFKAMLETEMKESHSGTINISDVSYDTLRSFVNYLYTADECLTEQTASDLLILADKYEVEHMKMTCEKFLLSKLNWNNAVPRLELAHQHNAKQLQESALAILTGNMFELIKTEEYVHLVDNNPKLVVEVYEAYLSKQVNAATKSD